MSRAQIIGVKRLDYTNKQGKHVQGYSLHYGEMFRNNPEHPESNGYGLSVESSYFSDERFQGCLKACNGDISKLVNKQVELVYNKYGLESVSVIVGQ